MRIHGEHRGVYRIVESLYCIPEPNRTLYANYTGIKIKTFKELMIVRKVHKHMENVHYRVSEK